MLYSPGGDVSLQGTTQPAAARTVSVPSCPVPDTGVHRAPSAELTTRRRQSSWPRWQKWPQSRVCPSPSREAASAFFSLFVVVSALCSSSSRLLAFNSRTQPDSRVPPAGSTGSEHPLQLHEAGKLCQPACSQWACMYTLLQTGSYRSAWRCQF